MLWSWLNDQTNKRGTERGNVTPVRIRACERIEHKEGIIRRICKSNKSRAIYLQPKHISITQLPKIGCKLTFFTKPQKMVWYACIIRCEQYAVYHMMDEGWRAGRRVDAGLNKKIRHLVCCGKIAADIFQVDQGCNDINSWRQIKATKQGIVQKC